MRAYWAIVSARFRMLLQYRAAAVAGFGTQLFWGLIRMMIFEAFYLSTRSPQPMDYRDVVSYVWLGQAFLLLIPFRPDEDVRLMIRTGTVAYEMLRPLDLYALWFSRAVASRTAPAVLRSPPIFILAGLFFGLQPPPSLASSAAWILAMIGALLLSCTISLLMTISLLWTISGEGISQSVLSLSYLLSGMVIPIPLFPDRWQPILSFLPFRGLVDTPFRFYTGHIPPAQIWPMLAHQMAWVVVLVALGRWLLGRATRRLVIQGG